MTSLRRKGSFRTLVGLAGLLSAAINSQAALPADELVREGDAAYAQRENLDEARRALAFYEDAINADSKQVEARWKAARVLWWLGEHAASRREKIDVFHKGSELAKEAISLDAESVEPHFWYAGNLGSFGEARGVLKSLFLLKPIRREMEAVLKINDRYLGGGAYRVLGVVDYKVPGIAGGDRKRARERLEKALAIDPQDPFTYYYLAEYFSVVGDKAKARGYLQQLKQIEVRPESVPERNLVVRKSEALAKKLER